jgi:hypothetical protein
LRVATQHARGKEPKKPKTKPPLLCHHIRTSITSDPHIIRTPITSDLHHVESERPGVFGKGVDGGCLKEGHEGSEVKEEGEGKKWGEEVK